MTIDVGSLVTCIEGGMFDDDGNSINKIAFSASYAERATAVFVSRSSPLNVRNPPEFNEHSWCTVIACGRICSVLMDELEEL